MMPPVLKWGVKFERHPGFALGALLAFEKINGQKSGYLCIILGTHSLVMGRLVSFDA